MPRVVRSGRHGISLADTADAAGNRGRRWAPVWFALPAVALFGGVIIIPTLGSYWLALFNWSGVGPVGQFVGAGNFSKLFHDSLFLHGALHNVWIFLVLFAFTNTASLGLALMMNRPSPVRTFYRAVVFLPYVLSPLAVGIIWWFILSPDVGIANPALRRVGLGGLAQDWLGDPQIALWSVCAVLIWQWNALATVIFLAGLQTVPSELRDASRIDGAKGWRVLRDVTIPFLAPAITTVNVLLAVFAFRVFDQIYVLTGPIGAPGNATLVMSSSINATAFGTSAYASTTSISYAMAQGVFLFTALGVTASVILLVLRRRERRVYG